MGGLRDRNLPGRELGNLPFRFVLPARTIAIWGAPVSFLDYNLQLGIIIIGWVWTRRRGEVHLALRRLQKTKEEWEVYLEYQDGTLARFEWFLKHL